MIRYAEYTVVQQLKYFPVKGGISKHYNTHKILKKNYIDYKKKCEIPFGAYVFANHDTSPRNSNKVRMIDAIYLMTKDHVSHKLMNLNDGKLIAWIPV